MNEWKARDCCRKSRSAWPFSTSSSSTFIHCNLQQRTKTTSGIFTNDSLVVLLVVISSSFLHVVLFNLANETKTTLLSTNFPKVTRLDSLSPQRSTKPNQTTKNSANNKLSFDSIWFGFVLSKLATRHLSIGPLSTSRASNWQISFN